MASQSSKNFKKIQEFQEDIMAPPRSFFYVVNIFSLPHQAPQTCSSYNKGRRYPKKETGAHKSTQFSRRSSSLAIYFHGEVSHVLQKYFRGCKEAFG
jgi:hypothetical protein